MAAGTLTAASAFSAEAGLSFGEGWVTKTVEEAVVLDAFDDPEFENIARFGKENDHVEYGRFGYNGNGGMRVWPLQLAYSKSFRLKAKLKKGQRYIWSADIRKHGKVTVQTCMDAYYRNPRKYVSGGGAWGPACVPKDAGWERQTVDFIAKGDSEDIDFNFMIYCRLPPEVAKTDPKNPENYVEVDNIRLETAAPKWYVSNTWPIRNLIHGAEGRLRMNSTFFGDYLEKDAKPVYGARLLAGETVLAEDAKAADANGNFTLEFGKIAYRGGVKLEITLYDCAHRFRLGRRTFDLEVADPVTDRGIFVKENGVVLKDGKPYMPIGFYANFGYPSKKGFPEDYTEEEAERCLAEIHDAGCFNAIIDYSTYTIGTDKRLDWYYGTCAKYGIDVLADDFKETNFKELDRKMVKFRERAERLKKYPALIGFYNMDESPESAIPPLEKVRRMLNEVMPDRVVNICNIMRPAPYLPIADIQGGDCYPISVGGTLESADRRLGEVNALRPAAIWYAPQAYNWAAGTPGAMNDAELYKKSGREPQENEILSVALCNVANGAKGFFFYAYFAIYRCPIKEWIPKRWQWVCAAGRCLRELEPFIMSGEPIEELAKTDRGDRTRVVALSDGKGNRRVIVLGLGRKHDTEFTLPAGFGELKSRCGIVKKEGDRFIFRAGDFSCDVLQ